MGKNYVENSLKRFFKRKVKITMGLVVAFMIMGTVGYAAEYVENNVVTTMIKNKNEGNTYIYNNRIDISNNDSKGIWNFYPGGQENTYNFKDKVNINLSTTGSQAINNSKGIMEFNSEVTLVSDSNALINSNSGKMTFNDIVNLTSNKKSTLINSGIIDFEKDITIIQKGIDDSKYVSAIEIQNNSKTDFREQLNIKVGSQENKAKTDSFGISSVVANNTNTTLNSSSNANIEVYSEKNGTGVELSNVSSSFKNLNIKIDSENATGIKVSSNSNLNIDGDLNIYLNGKSLETGIEIHDGNVNLAGDVNIKASDYAIKVGNGYNTDYNGEVIINQNQNSTVNISGKIEASGKSKNLIDITFSNANSEFIGNTIIENQTSNINMEFSNEAVWNNTGDSSVTNLTMNNGIINNNSVENDITVDTLKGNGGTLNITAGIDEKTGEAVSGKIEIGKVENNNAHFDINYKGGDNLEVSQEKAKEVFDELTDNITVGEGELKADVKLEEGFVKGGYTVDLVVDKSGNQVGNIDYKLNSMVEGMRDLATINLLTWRQEMNSLNKRMGELRNSTGEHGVWSRVYTGKIENGSKYDNDYQTYQVGYDKKYTVDNGVMFVGGLVSYTDGETNYALGHGENYSVGAGIYATWLNNDGQFADVVLKQSRLHNKFDVRSKDLDKSQSGDYNNWGTSLSGQYGRRFDLNDKFFVEPSVELTLGRVDDTTYTTSAGVDVHQDTMYSLVGNVGTSVGYKFSDKGNVYARAALVKEFQGDIDTEYEKDGAFERISEDLGDTWAEFGVGVNYRFVENMNVYVDVQKTGEATVDNKWQANLGFRYEF